MSGDREMPVSGGSTLTVPAGFHRAPGQYAMIPIFFMVSIRPSA